MPNDTRRRTGPHYGNYGHVYYSKYEWNLPKNPIKWLKEPAFWIPVLAVIGGMCLVMGWNVSFGSLDIYAHWGMLPAGVLLFLISSGIVAYQLHLKDERIREVINRHNNIRNLYNGMKDRQDREDRRKWEEEINGGANEQ